MSEVSVKELLERLLGAPDARNLSSDLLDGAERMFTARGQGAHARWMRLERDGYGARTEATNLRDVLGADAPDEVVRSALDSRSQYGRVVVGGVVRQWPHFFVEGVDEMRRWEQRVGSSGGPSTIELEFELPLGERGPRALSFDRSIFRRVLYNIALEVGTALQSIASDR